MTNKLKNGNIYNYREKIIMDKFLLNYKFQEFLNKYSKLYDKDEINFIKNNFFDFVDVKNAPDILMQVYSYLGLLEDDLYMEHLKKIENNFDIGKNILEVGCGFLPAFANITARKQIRLKSGTITAIDPFLVINKSEYDNLILRKRKFKLDTNVKNFDLIVGIYPCEATEMIIKSACENKKGFYLAMCGCTHFTHSQLLQGYPINPESYQTYIFNLTETLLKKYNNGSLCIDKLGGHYKTLDYPILYNKK